MTDYSRLIRKYEPVLGFGKDRQRRKEAFFPMAVEDYVARCGLWHEGRQILPPGQVTLDRLAALGHEADDYYLAYATQDLIAQIPEPALAQAMTRRMTLSRLVALQDEMALSVRAPRRTVADFSTAGLDAIPALTAEADLALEAGVEATAVAAEEGRPPSEESTNLIYGDPDAAERLLRWYLKPTPVVADEERQEMVDLAPTGDGVAALDLAEADLELLPAAMGLADDELAARGMDVESVDAVRDVVGHILGGATQLGPEIRERALQNYYGGAPLGTPPTRPAYYYHVLPEHKGYLVLQYWFYYAYNDWGTGHGGINDHEGDWEGIIIFLRDEDTPEYVAYSRHIRLPPQPLPPWILGPDVRRWSDSGLVKLYRYHPVVRVGCGSHAAYVDRKTHVMGVEGLLWAEDHARDNQLRIGPGQRIKWEQRFDLVQADWSWFGGRWGVLERSLRGLGTRSPTGPRSKDRWDKPVSWAGIPSHS